MLFFYWVLMSASILFSPGCSKDIEEVDPEPPVVEPGGPNGNGYEPGNASGIEKDRQFEPDSARASEHQPGEDIYQALDGNYNTIYHSLWDQSRFPEEPVVMEFFFDAETEHLDYMLYHPRQDGGDNGHILSAKVYVKSRQDEEYQKNASVEFSNTSTAKRIVFPDGFTDPESLKLVVTKGNNDFVSAAQFEFFQMNDQSDEYASFFKDLSFSELEEGVERSDLEEIENDFIRTMALAIYDGDYEDERTGVYSTYPDPAVISGENKTNRMGSFDNMTGIHVRWGEQLVVFVDETEADLYVRIVNHHEGYGGQDFVLNPGVNRITSPANGLVYLIYHAENEHEARVNIASGSINGYFDISRHTNEDWTSLIEDATYGFFDLKGEKAHLTFTTDELRQFVTDATRLVEVYDSIVTLQQELMGLYKYDRVPQGRLYYRTNTADGVFMHATGDATEYAPGTLEQIANHERLRSEAIWGPAHETGHIHQTRPGLMWIGMTEVTVNIYSQHVQTEFGNPSRLQTEQIGGYNHRYDKGFAEVIASGIPHNAHDDVFVKLIPFWQLQLYFSGVKDMEDFYKDVHEQIRLAPDPPTDGKCQLEFVRTVCDVAGKDLTGFFKAWGFLTPIDQDISDYGTRRMTITSEEIQELKDYISGKGYPAPREPFEYITDETVQVFRSQQPMRTGSGSRTGDDFVMEGWENVVAFEVYHDDDLIYVSAGHSFSASMIPEDIEIYAVGANGGRQKVSL